MTSKTSTKTFSQPKRSDSLMLWIAAILGSVFLHGFVFWMARLSMIRSQIVPESRSATVNLIEIVPAKKSPQPTPLSISKTQFLRSASTKTLPKRSIIVAIIVPKKLTKSTGINFKSSKLQNKLVPKSVATRNNLKVVKIQRSSNKVSSFPRVSTLKTKSIQQQVRRQIFVKIPLKTSKMAIKPAIVTQQKSQLLIAKSVVKIQQKPQSKFVSKLLLKPVNKPNLSQKIIVSKNIIRYQPNLPSIVFPKTVIKKQHTSNSVIAKQTVVKPQSLAKKTSVQKPVVEPQSKPQSIVAQKPVVEPQSKPQSIVAPQTVTGQEETPQSIVDSQPVVRERHTPKSTVAQEPIAIVDTEPTSEPNISFEPNSEPIEKPNISFEPNSEPIAKPNISFEPNSEPIEKPNISLEPNLEPIEKPNISLEPNLEPIEKPNISLEPNLEPIEKPNISLEPNSEPIEKSTPKPSISPQPVPFPRPRPIASEGPIRQPVPFPRPRPIASEDPIRQPVPFPRPRPIASEDPIRQPVPFPRPISPLPSPRPSVRKPQPPESSGVVATLDLSSIRGGNRDIPDQLAKPKQNQKQFLSAINGLQIGSSVVTLDVFLQIDEQGRLAAIGNVKASSSQGSSGGKSINFEAIAKQLFRDWEFQPARSGGKPVYSELWLRVTIKPLFGRLSGNLGKNPVLKGRLCAMV